MLLLIFTGGGGGGPAPPRVGQVMWAEFSAPEGVAPTVSPVDPLVFGAALQLFILLGSPSILEALNGYLRS